MEAVGSEAVLLRNGGEFGGLAFGLEAQVAGADFGLVEALAGLEGADVVGDDVALVHEFGVGLDEAN